MWNVIWGAISVVGLIAFGAIFWALCWLIRREQDSDRAYGGSNDSGAGSTGLGAT